MANIILYKPSEVQETLDGLLNNKPDIIKNAYCNNYKFYKKNPFVRLTEYPVFMHHELSTNLVLEAKAISLGEFKITQNNSLDKIINDDNNKKKMLYFMGKNDKIDTQLGPSMYSPHDFSEVKCELVRMAFVSLSDAEIERLIINNRYYSEIVSNQDKLFYFDKVYNKDNSEVTFKLMETNNILNDEEYSIYSELCKRLNLPRSKQILDSWIKQITGKDSISKQTNKNYMQLLTRNGKYARR